MRVFAWTDGGNRARVAACAYVIADPTTGEVLDEQGFLHEGEWTNNDMELLAICLCLEKALEMEVSEIKLHSDSEWCVRIISREYKLKNEKFKSLLEKIWTLLKSLPMYAIVHVPREKNARADWICNRTMGLRRGKDRSRVPLLPSDLIVQRASSSPPQRAAAPWFR